MVVRDRGKSLCWQGGEGREVQAGMIMCGVARPPRAHQRARSPCPALHPPATPFTRRWWCVAGRSAKGPGAAAADQLQACAARRASLRSCCPPIETFYHDDTASRGPIHASSPLPAPRRVSLVCALTASVHIGVVFYPRLARRAGAGGLQHLRQGHRSAHRER